ELVAATEPEQRQRRAAEPCVTDRRGLRRPHTLQQLIEQALAVGRPPCRQVDARSEGERGIEQLGVLGLAAQLKRAGRVVERAIEIAPCEQDAGADLPARRLQIMAMSAR